MNPGYQRRGSLRSNGKGDGFSGKSPAQFTLDSFPAKVRPDDMGGIGIGKNEKEI